MAIPNAYGAIDKKHISLFHPTLVRQNIVRDFIVYSAWLL